MSVCEGNERGGFGGAWRISKTEEERQFGRKCVINPNACGVDPAWKGIGSYELGEVGAGSGAIIDSILNWPCIEDWLDSRGSLLPHKVIGDILNRCCNWLSQA